MGRVLAAYGGGFKPPTRGHFEIVQKALNEFPEIDEFFIYVGGKERNGIDQAEAIQVWEIYKKYLANKIDIQPAKQPIKSVLDLAKENPQDIVYFILGYREGREDDTQDITDRSKLEEKYPNLIVKTLGTPDPNMSGTNARKAIADEEEFIKFLPDEVEEKSEIWNIIRPAVNENKLSLDDTILLSKTLRDKDKMKQIHSLLVQMFPKQKEFLDYNYKNDQFNDFRPFIFYIDEYIFEGPKLIPYTELKLDPDAYAEREKKYKEYVEGKIDKYFNSSNSDPRKVDLSKVPPITIDAEGMVAGGNHRAFLAIKQQKPLKAYQVVKANNTHPNVEKILNIIGRKNQKENIDPKSQKQHKGKAAPFGSAYKPLSEEIVGSKIHCNNCDWSWEIEDGGADLFICHKCNHDNTEYIERQKFTINENATYTKKINLIDILATFTQHMLDMGMNISPLPKLEFIDGDSENASQFLGKTAYYDPNTQTIVLYTEGRHPKDITRSYAHEMVHHMQNLEDRLGNIQTTNTQEDDNLNNIEAEANLKGTMTFRNWTDSLNEDKSYKHKFGFNDKLGKDPFGLNQFAREIATEVEDIMNKEKTSYKIFSDMDGVLTDFDKSFLKYSEGIPPREYEKTYGKEKFWELIDGKGKVGFWVGMPWMEDGKQYWDYIKNYDTELLSSPSRSSTSRLGKRLWVRNNMPGIKLTLAQAAKKQNYAAPNHILIDDRPSNIDQWRSQGGIGILHTSAADTISQLKKLGL
jgi:hypothetical protein